MKKKQMDITVTNTWKDRVCPSMIEFNKTDFQLENAVCTVYSIFSYPSSGDLKWLKRAVTSIDNTMVVIYNEAGDKKELLDSVDYSVREKRVHISETIDTKEREALGAQAEIDRMMDFSQRIMSDNVNIVKITVYIVVFASTQDELIQKCREVEGRLSGYGFVLRRIPYKMEEGFDACTPICDNRYSAFTSLTMPADVFYAGLGIIPSFGINDPTGVYLGFDETGNPVFIDNWSKSNSKTNYNYTILGKPGSGKSATVKTMMVHELSQGTKMYVLDPEEEYLVLAEHFKGNIIDASGGVDAKGDRSIINPLQLTDYPEELDDLSADEIREMMKNSKEFKGSVSSKISWLKGWFRTYIPELNMSQLALLEDSLYETYQRKGLDESSDPRTMRNDEHPTMSDLGEVLKERKDKAQDGQKGIYDQLLILLNSALVGTDRYLFNGYTNVNLNNRFNVINVHKLLNMPDNVKNAQFSNITQYIWLALTKNRAERSLLAVDEAHLFINKGSQATFEFLGQLCKRARKYLSGLWIMTQNISDFLHPEVARYGEAILNNAATKLIMKSDATDLQKICSLFQLNDGEQTLIKNSGVGQGLLIAGDMRVYANIEIEPEVLQLCQAGGGK